MFLMINPYVTVSAPGRICLFGEHQDYLKLPVITAAINLRVVLTGMANKTDRLSIDLPDIGATETLPLLSNESYYSYEKERDYFRSVVNVLKKSGYPIQKGCDCRVQGKIPINSGTSSSS
ncbi:MAG: GHMP kinase, partial [Calditrichales bacterium]